MFGIGGLNALGHLLTPQDQRLELAYACIGGLYAWLVNGDDWGTTAIPGTPAGSNFAIPEMGDSAAYPRGWLGLPTGAAVRVAAGEWKRTFTGGRVYANASSSAWSVRRPCRPRSGRSVREVLEKRRPRARPSKSSQIAAQKGRKLSDHSSRRPQEHPSAGMST